MAYKIKKKVLLNAPIDEVFKAYRDQLCEIAKAMSLVESIKVIKREEIDHIVKLENLWEISGNIPHAIKRIIPRKLFTYYDNAIWDEEKMICTFNEEPADGSGIYHCSGKNVFIKENGQTSLTIELNLTVFPNKISGITGFILQSFVPKIERIIAKQVIKSLETTSKMVAKFVQNKKLQADS